VKRVFDGHGVNLEKTNRLHNSKGLHEIRDMGNGGSARGAGSTGEGRSAANICVRTGGKKNGEFVFSTPSSSTPTFMTTAALETARGGDTSQDMESPFHRHDKQ
jgi:hypothetical protein